MTGSDDPGVPASEFCVLFGANQGAALPLGGRGFSLGSGPQNDIVLDGAGIAERHAMLSAADGRIVLETEQPVWTGHVPRRGRVELAFDTPFRIGSCLCVVTANPDEWLERDVSALVAELFQAADALETEASGPETLGPAGDEAATPEMRQPRAARGWEIYDRRRLVRAASFLLLLALLVLPATDWLAMGSATAFVVSDFRSAPNAAGAVAPAEEPEPPGDRRQVAELQSLIDRVDPGGRLQVMRGPNGGLAVEGFVLSGSTYVRLLSGLSMLPFPVDLRVDDRGSQIKALELLVSHTNDANLEVSLDEQTGRIRVAGSLPTQEQAERFVQQVRLELPGLADIAHDIEGTETVARVIAGAVQQAKLDKVKVSRTATEIYLAGVTSDAGMSVLDDILAEVTTAIPIHNQVKRYESQEEIQLTASDLGVMAILMGPRPVVLDRHGNRFGVGDRLAGSVQIVEIRMNEIVVKQGADLAQVVMK